jgi:hypothetical protein
MTAYLLLDALSRHDSVVISDALDLTPLSMGRARITAADRLVVVAYDRERAWGSVTVNAWLRAGRGVNVIGPVEALSFDVSQTPPERRKPTQMHVEGRAGHARSAIDSLDLTHVAADWRSASSFADERPTCVMCSKRICPGQYLASGSLTAHVRCRKLGQDDAARLAALPRGGLVEPSGERKADIYARRSLQRLLRAGYLTASEVDGVTLYKRSKAHVGG